MSRDTISNTGRASLIWALAWTRTPCCQCSGQTGEAVRFASPDSLEEYVAGAPLKRTAVSAQAALEEEFFLGLRLNRGVDLKEIARKFGEAAVEAFAGTISGCVDLKLLEREGDVIRLTGRGRLLSNEVFERFIGTADIRPGASPGAIMNHQGHEVSRRKTHRSKLRVTSCPWWLTLFPAVTFPAEIAVF